MFNLYKVETSGSTPKITGNESKMIDQFRENIKII